MFSLNKDPKSYALRDVCEILLDILKQNIANDRVAIPTLEVIAFLLDGRILQLLQDTQFKYVLIRRSGFLRLTRFPEAGGPF